jgi:hypothetical protein
MATGYAGSNTFNGDVNGAGSLNSMFKESYADKLGQLIPDGVKLLNKVEFLSKDKQPGNLYHQPVILGMEHGVTFATSDDDAFSLNAPVAGVIKDAQVRGNPVVLRSVLGYVAASRALQGGQKSFMDATKYLVANMIRSIAKKLEIEMLYGAVGYATVASQASAVITITTAEWAPGIWAGAEGMPIDFIANDNGATLCSAPIASVDMDARTITLGTATAGSHGAIGTELASMGNTGVTIYHKGAYGNEFSGIHKILTNTGTLFNISASTYNLWKGNSYAVGGALTLSKLEKGIARAIEKGLDQDVTVLVNPRTWTDLMAEQTALRQIDSSYSGKQVEAGHSSLKFHGLNGVITVEPSIYVKEGYAYALVLEEFKRVGSTDVTFKRPGKEGEFFRELESNAGFELRCFSDQALFCACPGKMVVFTGIVNT